MKENKTCCFAGHRQIHDSTVKLKIKQTAISLIEKGTTVFLVGNYGDFDRYAASVIRSLKEEYPFIQLDLVIPYLTKEMITNKEWYESRFHQILVADIPEHTPHQLKILKGNEYLVNQSDYLIAYVMYSYGGAAKTMAYAKRKEHITIFNLAK